jgi:hypothetical protein
VDVSGLDASLGGSQRDCYDLATTSERMRAWDALYEKQLDAAAPSQGSAGLADSLE